MENKKGNIIGKYLELSKIKIMIPVGLTGFTGYFIFDSSFSSGILPVTLGIILMAVSASVLNQLQEISIDSRMERTRGRPLPSGIITGTEATIFLFVCLISGIIILYMAGNSAAAITALITIIWYNGVYTYAKRYTAFAVVPGAVTGALPPLIGWLAAGGGILDKPIVFIEFLFFTGQIPHFWLLILKYGEEYRDAGMPSLINVFNIKQIGRLTFTWVATSVIAALFLCHFGIIRSNLLEIILLLASVAMIREFSGLLKSNNSAGINYRKYSFLLNLYYLVIIILLISDRVIGQNL